MLKLDKELKNGGYKARLIMQVHDELIVDCPKSEAGEVELLVKKCMAPWTKKNTTCISSI